MSLVFLVSLMYCAINIIVVRGFVSTGIATHLTLNHGFHHLAGSIGGGELGDTSAQLSVFNRVLITLTQWTRSVHHDQKSESER